MKILTRNGYVCASALDGKVLVFKPYVHAWGFKLMRDSGLAALYDLVYSNLNSEFTSEDPRDGGVYSPARDTAFHVMNISLSSIRLQDTPINRENVAKAIYYVCYDNPALNCFDVIGDADEDLMDDDYGVEDGYLSYVRLVCLVDPNRSIANKNMDDEVKRITDFVFQQTGKNVGDQLTVQEKIQIAKMLHDWIVNNATYATIRSYYEQFAFTVFWTDNGRCQPVCVAFSAAYTYLCNLYGINCVFARGTTYRDCYGELYATDNGMAHAWCIVAFGAEPGTFPTDRNAWTPVDVTFDVHLHDDGVEQTDKFFCSRHVYYGDRTDEETVTREYDGRYVYPIDIPTGTI